MKQTHMNKYTQGENKFYLCERENVDCISKNIAIIMFTIRFKKVISFVLNINKTTNVKKGSYSDQGLKVSYKINFQYKENGCI